jgi:hypothetical protein
MEAELTIHKNYISRNCKNKNKLRRTRNIIGGIFLCQNRKKLDLREHKSEHSFGGLEFRGHIDNGKQNPGQPLRRNFHSGRGQQLDSTQPDKPQREWRRDCGQHPLFIHEQN